ncbi:hypothetical protein SG34_000165 [Thalassomonas viridans]|uniref:Uncharacterized protein n=1 Tax=Thalassomonas viridans TaxID=137584 RepID=A0AAE9Z5A6_9GAMM|nr:hypothetical protein [Thalassomonas viridans]WDE05402.1 hypothetical protein SG34_000165 [Thalassomonas viridans]
MNRKAVLSLSIAAGIGLSSGGVMALPDVTKGNPLPILNIITPDTVGDIMPDHENPNTLHVGPARKKEVYGNYAHLGGSGPMCVDFVNIQHQAYLTLPTVAQREAAVENNTYVSNWFQLSYAINAENDARIAGITEAFDQIAALGVENAEREAQWIALRDKWRDLGLTISDLEGRLDDLKDEEAEKRRLLSNQNTLNTSTCMAMAATDPNGMVQCIINNSNWYLAETTKIDNWYSETKAPLDAELADAKAEKSAMSDAYYAAKGADEAYDNEIANIEAAHTFSYLILEAQWGVANRSWELETDVLEEEGSEVVGRVSAGYNLFGNETIALANTLAANADKLTQAGLGPYEVKELNVFNVRLNSGITITNVNTDLGDNAPGWHKNVISYPADTLMSNNILNEWAMPFEREDRAETLHFDSMDKDSFASGGFDFYVTKSASCAEYEQAVEETYTSTTDGGIDVSWTVNYNYAEPAPDHTVFTQNVGLSYNYYAYPGKIKGECTINVDRMNTYWRNAGKKSSWSWFRKKNESWDNTRQTVKNDMGMECIIDLPPQSDDQDEALKIAEDFERAMYDDMWQMFIAVYAKEYTVEVVEPDTPELEKSTVGASLGNGLIAACPANVWCQIGGIVLKTLDELGGSKAQGTTSSYAREYGTIKKVYDKDTWTVKQGSSSIDVKVCKTGTCS